MKKATLFELAWMLPSIALPFGMLVAIGVTAFGAGIHVPTEEGRVDPRAVEESPPFDELGLVETAPGKYEVTMVARTWSYTPNEFRVPVGAEVTFVATSVDVVHGLLIPRKNLNLMVLPGQIARATLTFDEPGEFPYVCHEFCGAAHHTMWGRVIVEPEAVAGGAAQPAGAAGR